MFSCQRIKRYTTENSLWCNCSVAATAAQLSPKKSVRSCAVKRLRECFEEPPTKTILESIATAYIELKLTDTVLGGQSNNEG